MVQESSKVLAWSIKCVAQRFTPDLQLCSQMELFRQMVNEAIRIGLDKHLTSLKALSVAAYPQLKPYQTDSRYKLCAISRATGILKNHRKLSKKHTTKKTVLHPTILDHLLRVEGCTGLSENARQTNHYTKPIHNQMPLHPASRYAQ